MAHDAGACMARRFITVLLLTACVLGSDPRLEADEGAPLSVAETLRLLGSRDAERRGKALAALDQRLPQEAATFERAIPRLERVLLGPDAEEARLAARLIACFDHADARRALIDALDPDLQRPGAPFADRLDAIASVRGAPAIALERRIIVRLREPRLTVERKALLVEALGRCAGPATLSLLLIERSDEPWLLTAARARALASRLHQRGTRVLDPSARRMLEVLIRMQASEITAIRLASWEALTRLTGRDWQPGSPHWRRWWSEQDRAASLPSPAGGGRYAAAPPTSHTPRFYSIPIRPGPGTRVAFCLDISQSMWGEGIAQARRELGKTLQELPSGHAFTVVAFNQQIHAHGDDMLRAHPINVWRAIRWCEAFDTVGGTNLFDAVAEAFEIGRRPRQGSTAPQILHGVYVLSDGAPNHGRHTAAKPVIKHLRALAGEGRVAPVPIHGVAAGERATDLLRRLAQATGGRFVRPEE